MASTALITSEQYLSQPEQFDEHGNRIKDELIGGEIVLMPPPSRRQDVIRNRILKSIILFLESNRSLGLEAYVELAFAVSKYDTFVPDVAVIEERRAYEGDSRIIQGAPDLAIEAVSPSDSASYVNAKALAYLRNGAQSVWIVYPEQRSVDVRTAGGARLLKSDDAIDDPLLPGYSEPISRFFERL